MITATIDDDGNVSLVGKQGTSWNLPLELYEDEENTVPFSLAGYQARGQYRENYTPGAPILITFNCAVLGYDAATNPGTNKIEVSATPAQSTMCQVLSGVYDIEIYQNENTVERVLEGTLTMTAEVTR